MDSNFKFLEKKWPELSELAKMAEENLYSDPNTTMVKLRMFTEQIVDYMFAYDKLNELEEDSLFNKLKLLEREGLINEKMADVFHTLRIEGNKAVHECNEDLDDAQSLLSLSYKLGVWFMKLYGEWDFREEEFELPVEKENEISIENLEKKYNNIITNLQKEIEDIKNNQEKLINKNERVELSQEISDSIMFNASENEIIKITEESQKGDVNPIDSSYKFITTDIDDLKQNKYQSDIWDSVRKSFSGRQCIAYWKYPLFSRKGEKRREPDIIIADKELGIIIIEIREEQIDELDEATNEKWIYKNGNESSPLFTVEDQLYALKGLYQDKRSLRNVYGKTAVVLPQIKRVDWEEKNFNSQNIIFGNELGKKTFLNKLKDLEPIFGRKKIDDNGWNQLLMTLTGQITFQEDDQTEGKKGMFAKAKDYLTTMGEKTQRRGEVKATIKKDLFEVDMQQEVIGKTIPPGPQRIRGIAGSGKTVLLAQKAAHMHLKHPDWKIALIFFTRSLYDNVINEVDKWLRRFSNGERGYDTEDNNNLEILHAWGAKDQKGFYREICKEHGINPLHAKRKKLGDGAPNEKLVKACKILLKDVDEIKKLYDAILIDEAQDLVVDNPRLKYHNKQPFYWLAYKTLKPLKDGQKRIIWAYDEAQSLNSLNIPTAPQLFGDEPEFKRMVSGFHEGGIRKSEIMNKCYRTPGPVLTAAHAIGMGLMRPEGMLRGYTTQEDWENIGYEVLEGSFNPVGQEVTLYRPKEMTPNRVPELWNDDVIKFQSFNTRKEELNKLVENLKYNIETDELNPSRDILVIVLGEGREAFKLKIETAKKLKNSGIDIYIPSALKNNIFYPKYPNTDRNKFWNVDGVTICNTYRAKGNEAYMVYVVGLDKIAEKEDDFSLRNQLFVALSRTKGWLNVSGIGNFKLYEEFKEVLNSGNKFNFVFQRPLAEKIENDSKKNIEIKVNDVIETSDGKRAKVIDKNNNILTIKISGNQKQEIMEENCEFIREGRSVY